MFDLEGAADRGRIWLIIFSILAIFISGIVFGVFYYMLDLTTTNLQTVDCEINNNPYFSDCQELFAFALYPVLSLKTIFVWMSALFIFILLLAILVNGYQSGSQPWTIGILILSLIFIVYGSIELSNLYVQFLENPIAYAMMVDFSIYNKVMINLPWFTFITGIMAIMLSIVNYQKGVVNRASADDFNY